MTTATSPEKTVAAPTQETSPLAALLSYLIPGLGQIYQGRVAKGVLFLGSLYGLFFYGMYLDSWSNVYLRSSAVAPKDDVLGRTRAFMSDCVDRLPFVGQFPIGVVAWPALWQYKEPAPGRWHDFMSTPAEHSLNELQSDGDKFWDLGLIYTVIAGVLNVLVIYDAYAGPAFTGEAEAETGPVRREEAVA